MTALFRTSLRLSLPFITALLCLMVNVSSGQLNYVEVLPRPRPVPKRLNIRRFAKIPNYRGAPSRIVGITAWGNDLYVCTSVSGGYIYRVQPSGRASLWFDVPKAMRRFGRVVNLQETFHGGVRSIAFHPAIRTNGRFYVSVVEKRTKPIPANRYLSRPSGRVADSDSVVLEWRLNLRTNLPNSFTMREVLRIGLRYVDHPIKQMAFKGNLLYIGHGDGSVHSDITGTGQNGRDALGKILRINPLPGPNGKRYLVPPSNPYVTRKGFLNELFAIGFRNPHNLCFAKKGPQDLFVADAGRDNVEEVNIVKPGRNYGWALREGPFVQLARGGLGIGIARLPPNDAKYNLVYPNVALGHYGRRGIGFDEAKQSIAGSCPIENGSPLNNIYIYANFPSDGNLYFSYVSDMRRARVKGVPRSIKGAPMYRPQIFFDRDNSRRYRTRVNNFRDIVRFDLTSGSYAERADVRFGRGRRGEIYISSKQNGMIYLIQNSLPVLARSKRAKRR